MNLSEVICRFGRLAMLFVAMSLARAEQLPPDVLFIAVDDLNDWVGVLGGHPQARTPNIDRLARRGLLFTNAHASAPACNPSRASLMTGVRPSTSGVYNNPQDWRRAKKLRGLATIPQTFRAGGYRVIGGGKIYHAHTIYPWGFRGFPQPEAWDDYYPSRRRQLPDEITPLRPPVNSHPGMYAGVFDWAPIVAEDSATGDGQVVAWAERQLAEKHDKPLFLAVGIYRPHIPWYVPEKYFAMYPLASVQLPRVLANDVADVPAAGQRMLLRHWHKWVAENGQWKKAVQGYLASVTFADAMVGRLLDALDSSGRADRTVIVLWSDHGYHLGVKEHWEKFALWEQTTRVPLIFAGPGVAQAGGRSERPVSLLDIYPTLAELAGLPIPKHVEGRSLTPLLGNPEADWPYAVVTTQRRNNHAVRSERHRYIRYADGSEELYDHASDPLEWKNLAGDARYNGIKAKLAKWLPKVNVEDDPPLPARE